MPDLILQFNLWHSESGRKIKRCLRKERKTLSGGFELITKRKCRTESGQRSGGGSQPSSIFRSGYHRSWKVWCTYERQRTYGKHEYSDFLRPDALYIIYKHAACKEQSLKACLWLFCSQHGKQSVLEKVKNKAVFKLDLMHALMCAL